MFVKKESKFYSVPLIINIILYKNNYFDNLIINEIRKSTYYITNQKNIYSVNKEDLEKIIKNKFNKEIERINAVPSETLFNNVNSAYFLNNILSNFENLKMLNVEISDKRNFSRVFYSNHQRLVGFDYKVHQGILDFPKYLNLEQLHNLNELLSFMNVYDKDLSIGIDPYYIIKSKDFISRLMAVEKIDPLFIQDIQDVISIIYEMLETKIEEDDCFLIIKTDF